MRPDASTMLMAPRQFCTPWRVMLDAAGVQQEARRRRAPQLRRLADRALGDARDLGRAPRRPLLDVLGDLLEADGVFLDEGVIEPVVLDHQVEDAVEQGDVAARLDGQEEVAGPRGQGVMRGSTMMILAPCSRACQM